MEKNRNLNELFVEVTNHCHLSCIHCSSCAGPQAKESIPLSSLLKLIDDAKKIGLQRFTVSGGEPLIYPELTNLIEYAAKQNITAILYTCGVMDTNGAISPITDSILSKLVSFGNLEKIIFSLHGGEPSTHEKITGVEGSFAITLNSLKKVVAYNIPTELHFVPMKYNYEEFDKVVSIADESGVNKISILRLVEQGRCSTGARSLLLDVSEMLELTRKAKEISDEHPRLSIRIGAPLNCLTLNATSCSAAKNKLLISATGEIFPCEAFKFLKGTRPKIYDNELSQVWENDRLLNDLLNLDSVKVIGCAECSLRGGCLGGCPGRRFQEYGDFYKGADSRYCLCRKEG